MKIISSHIKSILFLLFLLIIASCGVKNGSAVTSSGSGPVPQVSADCASTSCM